MLCKANPPSGGAARSFKAEGMGVVCGVACRWEPLPWTASTRIIVISVKRAVFGARGGA